MTKFWKKLFALLLSAALCLGHMPGVLAAEAEDNKCGDDAYWTVDATGVMTITGVGELYNSWIMADAWEEVEFTEVIIEDGITGLGGAFRYYYNIYSISLPSTLHTLGDYEFNGCDGLSSITIPASVYYLGEAVFSGCSGLSQITFLGNAPDVNEYGGPFGGQSFLRIYYPEDNPTWTEEYKAALVADGVVSYAWCDEAPAPVRCGDDAYWTLDDTGLLTVTGTGRIYNRGSEEGILWNPQAVTSAVIEEGITCIGSSAFRNSNLTSISLPSTLETTEYMAFSGSALEELVLPDGFVGLYWHSFTACESLTSVVIPASVEWMEMSAFMDCINLTEVTFLGDAPELVDELSPFPGVPNLTIYYPADNDTWTDEVKELMSENATWVPVEPVAKVTSVTVTPAELTITEGTNGESGAGYWHYNWKDLITVTATFSDGNTVNVELSESGFEYDGIAYMWSCADVQAVENWQAGETYTLTLTVEAEGEPYSSASASFDVTIAHDFADATCTAPKTCKLCGATEGETAPHDFADATCTAPKTCKLCGAAEGEPIAHDYTDATCTAPKTCKVCGAAEGEPIAHDYTDATCTAPKTCKVCGATEGEALEHPDADADNLCDVCGAVIKTVDIDTDGDGKADINLDTDGDGVADVNLDRDGDNLPDLNVDTDGDGVADENVDTDGDGLPNYEVVEGDNGSHYKNEAKDLTFKINGLFSGFQGLEINGEAVPQEYYEAVEGSTVITLKAAYLTTLAEGSYTVTAVYADGAVDCSFAVAEEKPLPPVTPVTGDTVMLLPLALLAVLSLLGAALCVTLKKYNRG